MGIAWKSAQRFQAVLRCASLPEGVTQQQLAQMTGIPQRHISEIETVNENQPFQWQALADRPPFRPFLFLNPDGRDGSVPILDILRTALEKMTDVEQKVFKVDVPDALLTAAGEFIHRNDDLGEVVGNL